MSGSLESGVALDKLGLAYWVDVTVTAALLDSAGSGYILLNKLEAY